MHQRALTKLYDAQRSTNPFEMDRPAALGVRHSAASYLPNSRIARRIQLVSATH
jgi:hypothetical protein